MEDGHKQPIGECVAMRIAKTMQALICFLDIILLGEIQH